MNAQELFTQLGVMITTKSLANNQVIVSFSKGEVFQSYGKTIGAKVSGKFYFDPKYHDYSNTTSKYCTRWSGCSTENRRRACADPSNERFQYVDLN